MAIELLLLWMLTGLSGTITLLRWSTVLKKWPSISNISFLNNVLILVLFYSSLSGLNYYVIHLLCLEPLIILLVYQARKDPLANWSYRAMCLLLIFQVVNVGSHILTGNNFIYYDKFSLLVTLLEFVLILTGGINVRPIIFGNVLDSFRSFIPCGSWVRSHTKD